MKINGDLAFFAAVFVVVVAVVSAIFYFAERANKVDEQACIAANGDVLRLRSNVVCLKKGSIIDPKK